MKPASNSGLSRVKRYLLGIPEPVIRPAQFLFGSELHSMWLEEGKRENMLTADEEQLLGSMQRMLVQHASAYVVAPKIQLEVEITKKINGVMCRGFLDIYNKPGKLIADLKTTSTRSYDEFLASCIAYDYFRQAYFYQKLTGVENFHFIAAPKLPPHKPIILDVRKHPRQMYAAKQEFEFLLYYYGKHHAV